MSKARYMQQCQGCITLIRWDRYLSLMQVLLRWTWKQQQWIIPRRSSWGTLSEIKIWPTRGNMRNWAWRKASTMEKAKCLMQSHRVLTSRGVAWPDTDHRQLLAMRQITLRLQTKTLYGTLYPTTTNNCTILSLTTQIPSYLVQQRAFCNQWLTTISWDSESIYS